MAHVLVSRRHPDHKLEHNDEDALSTCSTASTSDQACSHLVQPRTRDELPKCDCDTELLAPPVTVDNGLKVPDHHMVADVAVLMPGDCLEEKAAILLSKPSVRSVAVFFQIGRCGATPPMVGWGPMSRGCLRGMRRAFQVRFGTTCEQTAEEPGKFP